MWRGSGTELMSPDKAPPLIFLSLFLSFHNVSLCMCFYLCDLALWEKHVFSSATPPMPSPGSTFLLCEYDAHRHMPPLSLSLKVTRRTYRKWQAQANNRVAAHLRFTPYEHTCPAVCATSPPASDTRQSLDRTYAHILCHSTSADVWWRWRRQVRAGSSLQLRKTRFSLKVRLLKTTAKVRVQQTERRKVSDKRSPLPRRWMSLCPRARHRSHVCFVNIISIKFIYKAAFKTKLPGALHE